MANAIRTLEAGANTRHTWNLTTADATGEAISHPGSSDRTVQLIADTAGSATAILEGSLESTPVTWFTLTDGQGNAISFTASGGEMVAENVLWLRPRLSTAGSGADWRILLMSRSTMR